MRYAVGPRGASRRTRLTARATPGETKSNVVSYVRILAGVGALFGSAAGCSGGTSFAETGGPRYAALEHAPTTSPEESRAARASHAIQTVFIILMENHNWRQIKGSASAPFINGTLLQIGAHAENYFNAPSVHPSESNYIWMEAGDSLGIADDAAPATNFRTTKKHLTSLLEGADVSWKSYQEGISGTDCPLTPQGLYDPKHNAVLYFDDMTDGRSSASPKCIAHVRPFTELARDLNDDTVAAYNFITPNLCNDMHNDSGCPRADAIKNGDDWLGAELPNILHSAAYARGGAVFVTWDESDGPDAPIGMLVLSPFAIPGYETSAHYTHSALLRTVQEIFAVQPFLRNAAESPNLSSFFKTYP